MKQQTNLQKLVSSFDNNRTTSRTTSIPQKTDKKTNLQNLISSLDGISKMPQNPYSSTGPKVDTNELSTASDNEYARKENAKEFNRQLLTPIGGTTLKGSDGQVVETKIEKASNPESFRLGLLTSTGGMIGRTGLGLAKAFFDRFSPEISKKIDKQLVINERSDNLIAKTTHTDDGKRDARELSNLAGSAIGSVLTSASLYALTHSTTAVGVAFGIIQGSDTYIKAKKAGKTNNEASVLAVADGTVSTLLEKVGMDLMFGKYWKSMKPLARVPLSLVGEIGQELSQNVASNLIANPGAVVPDRFKETQTALDKIGYDKSRDIFEGTMDTIIATTISAGTGMGLTKIVKTKQVKNLQKDFANKGVPITTEEANVIYGKLTDAIDSKKSNFKDIMQKEVDTRTKANQVSEPITPATPVAQPEMAQVIPETTKQVTPSTQDDMTQDIPATPNLNLPGVAPKKIDTFTAELQKMVAKNKKETIEKPKTSKLSEAIQQPKRKVAIKKDKEIKLPNGLVMKETIDGDNKIYTVNNQIVGTITKDNGLLLSDMKANAKIIFKNTVNKSVDKVSSKVYNKNILDFSNKTKTEDTSFSKLRNPKNTFMIASAYNPMGKTVDSNLNKAQHTNFKKFLTDNNITFKEQIGKYGAVEKSILMAIKSPTEIKAVDKYLDNVSPQAENIIIKNGNAYRYDPRTFEAYQVDLKNYDKGLETPQDAKDYYSEIDGRKYQLPLYSDLETKSTNFKQKIYDTTNRQELYRTQQKNQGISKTTSRKQLENRTVKRGNKTSSKVQKSKYQITTKTQRLITSKEVKQQIKAVPFFKNLTAKEVEKILTPEGKKAFGVYKNGIVEYVKNPDKTTFPHEAFHVFLDQVVSTERKNEILDLVSQRGDTKLQTEERLSQQFAEWFVSKNRATTKLGQFFEWISNKIKEFVGSVNEIEKIFNQVLSPFAKATGMKDSTSRFQIKLARPEADTRKTIKDVAFESKYAIKKAIKTVKSSDVKSTLKQAKGKYDIIVDKIQKIHKPVMRITNKLGEEAKAIVVSRMADIDNSKHELANTVIDEIQDYKGYNMTYRKLGNWINQTFKGEYMIPYGDGTIEKIDGVELLLVGLTGKNKTEKGKQLAKIANETVIKKLKTMKGGKIIVSHIKALSNKNYKALTDTFGKDIKKLDDYFYGNYKNSAKVKRALEHYKSTQKMKERKTLLGYGDAYGLGLRLKDGNPIENLLSETKAIAMNTALLGIRDEGLSFGFIQKLGKGVELKEGYAEFKDPVLKGYAGDETVVDYVNNITEADKTNKITLARSLKNFNSRAVAIMFFGSAFHLNNILMQASIDTAKTFSLQGFKDIGKAFKQAKESMQGQVRQLSETELKMNKYVTSDNAIQKQSKDVFHKWLDSWISKDTFGLATNSIKASVAFLPDLLFDHLIPGIKLMKAVEAFDYILETTGQEPTPHQMQEIAIEQQNIYGMMNEKILYGRNSTALSLIRFLQYFPGFSEGNINSTFRALNQGASLVLNKVTPKINEKFGTEFKQTNVIQGPKGEMKQMRSFNNVYKIVALGIVVSQILSIALTGKPPRKPKEDESVADYIIYLMSVRTTAKDKYGNDIVHILTAIGKDYVKFLSGIFNPIEEGPTVAIDRIRGTISPSAKAITDIFGATLMARPIVDYKGDRVTDKSDSNIQRFADASLFEIKRFMPYFANSFVTSRAKGLSVLHSISSAIGASATTEEYTKKQNKSRMLLNVKKWDERKYFYNPREIEEWNNDVKRLFENKYITKEMQEEFQDLIIDKDVYLQNKIYDLTSPSLQEGAENYDEAKKKKIEEILLGFDLTYRSADQILSDYWKRKESDMKNPNSYSHKKTVKEREERLKASF